MILNKVKFERSHFEAAPDLKLILVSATGTDNVDKQAAVDHGVVVCNVTAYGTSSVSQHTLMLMLMIATQAERYRDAVKASSWSASSMFCLMDYPIIDLEGRTLGIIGFGELGQAVGKLAGAFGMRVIVMGRDGIEYTDNSERVSFDKLLEQSDFVSLHGLLNEQTQKNDESRGFSENETGLIFYQYRSGWTG